MIFICVIHTVFHVHEEVSLCCLNVIATDKGLFLKEKVKPTGKIDMTINSFYVQRLFSALCHYNLVTGTNKQFYSILNY
jgi:hypothetical protein